MTKGIVLLSFGSATYAKYAMNMAYSIKHYCSVPVHLFSDGFGLDEIDQSIFDKVEIREFSKDPGYNKMCLYENSPFDRTLYLDVDGVCMKDVTPVFEALNGTPVYTQVIDYGPYTESKNYMEWAKNKTIWEHFKLKEDAILCSVQTSIIYFEKGKKAEKFFDKLKQNYSNPLPKDKYHILWGRRKHHPDEVYYAATLAQMNIVPKPEFAPVFFPDKIAPVSKILSDYFILSQFGAETISKQYSQELYDKLMIPIMRDRGKSHSFKASRLYKFKMIALK